MKKWILAFLVIAFWELPGRESIPFGDREGFVKLWQSVGTMPFAPMTDYTPEENPERPGKTKLVIKTDSSTGMIALSPKIDLKVTPIMRWRWRVVQPFELDPKADEMDDQVLHLNIGDGDRLQQRAIGYRWEHNGKIGLQDLKYYNLGQLTVSAITMRNRETPPMRWVTEERNIVADYREQFKEEIKPEFAIFIGGNSQHLQQKSIAEIDYIEFLSEEEAQADPIPETEK